MRVELEFDEFSAVASALHPAVTHLSWDEPNLVIDVDTRTLGVPMLAVLGTVRLALQYRGLDAGVATFHLRGAPAHQLANVAAVVLRRLPHITLEPGAVAATVAIDLRGLLAEVAPGIDITSLALDDAGVRLSLQGSADAIHGAVRSLSRPTPS